MHLILTIAAGMITICVLLMGWAMFRAKPDPNENEGFNEADIYSKPTLKKVK